MALIDLTISREEYAARQQRIRARMAVDGVDALLVTGQHNVRYATGFRGEPRSLLVMPDELVLATSFRCFPWAAEQTHGIELSTQLDVVESIRLRLPQTTTIGVEADISHARFRQLEQALEGYVLKLAPVVEAVRTIKSAMEIRTMRWAQRFAEEIFTVMLAEIRPGVSERYLRGRILRWIAEHEALDGPSFDPIVAAGENAWEIHHQPDMRQIRDRDMVIVDLGVVLHGYCSDMTRTVCIGTPSDEMRRLCGAVVEAQEAAFEMIRPGVALGEVDAAARAVIEAAGYGDSFTHGLGHPVGLSVHDPGPAFRRGVSDRLEAGMVLSVEPGAYLQGKFGVRIEDVVVVQEDGFENLMTIGKELISL